MVNIKLEINGKTVEADEGMSILQAARKADIDIPTLCYNENMAPYGACRLCMVEIGQNSKTKLVASCVYPVENNLVVKTESERVIKARKMILELLLPLCPTGPVKTLARKYGLERSRFPGENTGCILCGLCVRYCAEVKKAHAIGFIGRGVQRAVAFLPEVAPDICPTCRECFTLCHGGRLAGENLAGPWMPISSL